MTNLFSPFTGLTSLMAQFQDVMEVTSFSFTVIVEMDVIMVLVLGNMHHCCKLNVHTVVMMDP